MNICCLKHVSFEGPGSIAQWARSRGHDLKIVEVYLGGDFPELNSFDCLLVMGGPMNIYEDKKYPWLIPEKALIRQAIQSGKQVVGVCLGAQLIADALDVPVSRGHSSEIGWFAIERSADCPPEFALPERLRTCHWHGDTFALPAGARLLASSAAYPNQGFLYEDRILAWQCHLEATPDSLQALVHNCAEEITDGPYIMDADTLLSEPAETYASMQQFLFRQLDRLSEHPVHSS